MRRRSVRSHRLATVARWLDADAAGRLARAFGEWRLLATRAQHVRKVDVLMAEHSAVLDRQTRGLGRQLAERDAWLVELRGMVLAERRERRLHALRGCITAAAAAGSASPRLLDAAPPHALSSSA